MIQPETILLVSGKRKCGKDFICEKLVQKLGEDNCTIVRISGPLKSLYAKQHDLDWEELMSDSAYKENHRKAMITWSDSVRGKNPGYFCQKACEEAAPKKFWIVSDIRRKTDIQWFKEAYGDRIKLVRLIANEGTRKARGWVFEDGVDNHCSECDLDDFCNWDLVVSNNNDDELQSALKSIVKLVHI